VELKSVNNRYLDVAVRLPRNFLFAEESVKTQVAGHISRGKVDVFVSVDASRADDVVISVNEELARAYTAALRAIAESCGVTDDVTATAVGRMPEVLSVEKREDDKEAVSAALSRRWRRRWRNLTP
jgi:uncharacterized protein (TIGR00255 family)